MVAANQKENTYQALLFKALVARLKENPKLVQELVSILGGKETIQQVLSSNSSWVEEVTQHTTGESKQTVKADHDSVIKGVRQIRK